jgi:signal transduction histidine kinase
MDHHVPNNTERLKELASFQIAAATQAPGEDIYKTLHRITLGVQKIFEAEDALLILLDEDDPQLVIKNQLGAEDNWQSQTVQKMMPGIIAESIAKGETYALVDAIKYPVFNPRFDAPPAYQPKTYLCAPLNNDGACFGALVLINPLEHMLGGHWIDLFQILTTSISNSIYNARLLMQLKVSNADLEANCWELLNSRNTLRALFDNLPTSMYIVDNAYTVVAINMSRSNRQGILPRQVVGRICYEKLYGRVTPCDNCLVHETLNSGQNINRILRENRQAGEFVEWDISTYPILNDAGVPVQVIVSENDVTEKRIMETNLIRSEKMAAIGQVASGVAQEMFNPLSAIIANTQMVRQTLPTVNEDIFESLDLIEYAGTRASQVIQNLQKMAQNDDLENGPVDINETIDSALNLLNHEITKQPITIQKEYQTDLPILIGSHNRLQDIWVNLLVNSFILASPKDSRVTIRTEYKNGEYCIAFQDNGNGIPSNKLKKVFEPYFSVNPAGRSAGLGLSICLRAVKNLNGTIEVESQLDRGTKFTVILPG